MTNNNKSFDLLNSNIAKVSEDQINLNSNVYKKFNEYNDQLLKSQNNITEKIILEQKNFIEEGKNVIELN